MKPDRSEIISDAIGELDEKIVEEAANARTPAKSAEKRKRSRKPLWAAIGAAAACVVIAGGIIAMNTVPIGVTAAAEAVYPKMEHYPDESNPFSNHDKWWDDRRAQQSPDDNYADNLWEFYTDSTDQFLSGTEENKVYSPLNVYMALAMLAETTSGESQRQILDLLEAEDVDSLRTQAGLLWNANYCDDGAITSILGNSVWLDSSLDYNQSVMDRLAQSYYASSYSGEFGSEPMNKQLHNWLNKQTGGLLKDSVEKVHLDPAPETVLALYSTVLFRGKWDNKFDPNKNDTRIFHSPDGDIETTFMNQNGDLRYHWDEDYGAVRLSFVSGCSMWLILPDEDKTIDDVLESGEYMKLVKYPLSTNNSKDMIVNLSVPKFDVSSDFDLKEGLSALGITDVFSSKSAEFTLLDGDNSKVFVGKANHSARVKIDEEGCEAAAFTEMALNGAMPMPEDDKIDFVLDRPFLFVITGMDDQPLFTGTVYNP